MTNHVTARGSGKAAVTYRLADLLDGQHSLAEIACHWRSMGGLRSRMVEPWPLSIDNGHGESSEAESSYLQIRVIFPRSISATSTNCA